MKLEEKNHHWELNLNRRRQPRMFAQNQGLKYNADYKEEMNRLYNRNRNGEPLNLTPEERRQNPRVYNPEAQDRILNEARRLVWWDLYGEKVKSVHKKPAHKGNNNSNAEGIRRRKTNRRRKGTKKGTTTKIINRRRKTNRRRKKN